MLLAVLAVLAIMVGSRPVALATTWEAITAFDAENSDHLLVQHLRIPRSLLAVIVGGTLGVAGAVMQALTRNPLADPGILGVNAGAAVAIAAAIAFFGTVNVTAYMGFGLVGAAIAGGVVHLLGSRAGQGNPVHLVLAGAALSVVLLSLTQIILINSADQVFDQFRNWASGSLQGRGLSVLAPVSLLSLCGLGLAFSLARSLDAVALGVDLARALGTSPLRIFGLSALSVVMLCGAATAAAGPIGFIGLTAPHIARLVTGANHGWLLAYSMLIGAVLSVGGDALGRVIAPPGEIGLGIMVALIGGPLFIMLARRRRLARL